MNYFATLKTETDENNERANENNIKPDDIVTYKNKKGIKFYCCVKNVCSGKKTMNVKYLHFDGYGFQLLSIIDVHTGNNLSFSRKIHIMKNIDYS